MKLINQAWIVLMFGSWCHLGGGEASIGILLGHKPVDNTVSIAQISHSERLYSEYR